MFIHFLYALRAQDLSVGIGEWLVFMQALSKGLATNTEQLYALGRALLVRSEAEYDGYDLAFAESFNDASLPDGLLDKLADWLENGLKRDGDWVDHDFSSLAGLLKAFEERLKEQNERHDGGNRWVGTGGTSPFGHSGRGAAGVRVGGPGGGRSAVHVAMERRWRSYRADRKLDIRELQTVLHTLRNLARDGPFELDLDQTIEQTGKNAGDIEIVHTRSRKNRLKLVLMLDTGGSMQPHAERVERLFTAASRVTCFQSFKTYAFHNCVYNTIYTDIEQSDHLKTHEVLANLTHQHRLIFVGDASMAPYELFSSYGWPGTQSVTSGLGWLEQFKQRCPASIWLNPDPLRYWQHPTVSAIGQIFPMFELTVDGLEQGVKKLRAGR